jgi:hypothetical protein
MCANRRRHRGSEPIASPEAPDLRPRDAAGAKDYGTGKRGTWRPVIRRCMEMTVKRVVVLAIVIAGLWVLLGMVL